MSLRNGQKVSRRAHRTGREALRRACQSVVGAPATSRWETLENRLMMTISQIDPTYVVFEGEHADATIAAGSNGSTWMALGGAGVAGNASLPSDGKALVAIGQSTDVGNDRTTGSVSYPINFTTPGVYRMYVRGKFTGGGDNSFWIPNHPADGTGPINADPGSPNNNPFDNHNADTIRVGNYRWFGSDSADVPVTYTVGAAGDTTLTYRVREQGYMIDKVVLSRNLSLTAADLDALAGIGAQPTAGSVVAHYYNDNFWGINGASGTDSRPSAPSAGLEPVRTCSMPRSRSWASRRALGWAGSSENR